VAAGTAFRYSFDVMKAADRESLKRKLTLLRTQLIAAGPAKIEPNRRDPATAGVADEDAQALSEMLQVLASQRNRGQAELLGRIDAALGRLVRAPEDFGLCQDCEEELDPRRLALMPYATRCAACQARSEPRRGQNRKNLRDFK
jgi:DnaK suppressor protein